MKIEFENASFSYNRSQEALSNVALRSDAGEFILILGHNGAGKSTFLKLLNGILKPTVGSVMIGGISTLNSSPSELAGSVSVTFQNPADQIFASTVRQEIEFGPKRLRRSDVAGLVDRSLKLFHLDARALSHPYDLSLSERKLLTLASAVATDAPILAFDEPSAALSQPERLVLLGAIGQIRDPKRSIVVISHDLDLFLPYASRVIVLWRGRLAFHGTPSDFLQNAKRLRSLGIRFSTTIRLKQLLGMRVFEAD